MKAVKGWRHFRWQSRLSALAALVVVLVLQGCAATSYEPPAGAEEQVEAETDVSFGQGPAAGLYLQAREALAAGEAHRAEMILERALRIEPANPHYWHAMARIHFEQGGYSQTIELCRKSKSLAGNSRRLRAMNDRLIDQARERM